MSAITAETKSAVLLQILGAEVTDALLGQLASEDAGRLRAELDRLAKKPPPPRDVDAVLAEFDGLLAAVEEQASSRRPEPEAAPAGKPAAPPESREPAAARPEGNAATAPRVEAPAAADGDPLVPLRLLGPERLAATLQDEQPRTVAVLLNALAPGLAGEVLRLLPAAQRREVSLLLGQPLNVSRQVLQTIAGAVLQKGLGADGRPEDTSDDARARKTAEVLRGLERPERLAVVAALAERDPEGAARVRDHLYSFEDLLLVDDRSVQRLLGEVDSKGLALAVKGAPENVAAKLLNNLSKRARETLTEEMDFLGNVPSVQLHQARKAILEVMQRLDQAGELVVLE